MKRSPKRDVAQDITNLIISKIRSGTLPWRRLEKTGAGGAPLERTVSLIPASTASISGPSPTASDMVRATG